MPLLEKAKKYELVTHKALSALDEHAFPLIEPETRELIGAILENPENISKLPKEQAVALIWRLGIICGMSELMVARVCDTDQEIARAPFWRHYWLSSYV